MLDRDKQKSLMQFNPSLCKEKGHIRTNHKYIPRLSIPIEFLPMLNNRSFGWRSQPSLFPVLLLPTHRMAFIKRLGLSAETAYPIYSAADHESADTEDQTDKGD